MSEFILVLAKFKVQIALCTHLNAFGTSMASLDSAVFQQKKTEEKNKEWNLMLPGNVRFAGTS